MVVPVVVGFALGPVALGGTLAGALVSGVLLALLMSNAGGAWDNAKKYIERGDLKDEEKGGEAHKAAVVGDTVGDPLKEHFRPVHEHPHQAHVGGFAGDCAVAGLIRQVCKGTTPVLRKSDEYG